MRPLLARRRRGSAAVETAVSMIVLIPLIMYTLFLEDLLFYKLDQQETIVSTPWDFHHHDYRAGQRSGILGATQTFNQQTFWDHTSAWNTYTDPDHDAQDTDHHQAMTAHQCWLAQGGKEVACSWQEAFATSVDGRFNFMNQGGRVQCSAVLGVQNYFIPQQFMEWWARQALTDQRRWTGESGDSSIHPNAQQDAYTFPEDHFSVVFDPWALNYVGGGNSHNDGAHEPLAHPANMGSNFTSWMNIPYGTHKNGKVDKAVAFADEAINQQFLSGSVKVDGMGDDIDLTPPLAWSKDPAQDFGGHYPSGYQDSRVQQSHQQRTGLYMGTADNW